MAVTQAPKLFSPIRTGDEQLDRVQDAIAAALRDMQADLLLLRYTLAPATISSTATTKVAHGLGRVPRGRIVMGQTADARIWDTQAADATFLYLRASAAVTATLLVA